MKIVNLISGGIDSTTLLAWLLKAGYEPYPLTALYGQRHEKELDSARYVCAHYHLVGRSIDLSDLGGLLKSALTKHSAIPEVPETAEHYETLKSTVVPNRNMIFLSVAAGYANSIGAKAVAYAAHYSDKGVYPDCRPEFVKSAQTTLRLALDVPDFEVISPFTELTKADVVGWASENEVPLGLTWSCYKGLEKHCGVCSSCRERKRAFEEAGISDPTVYLHA